MPSNMSWRLGRIPVFALIAALVSACTEKGRSIHEHAPDQRQEPHPITQYNQPSPLAISEADLVKSAQKLLNPQNIRSPQWRANVNLYFDLHSFNAQVLKSIWSNQLPESVESLYLHALDLDCDSIVKNCSGLTYLAKAANSYQVVVELSKRHPERRFRILNQALYIANGEWAPDLLDEILTHANEFVGQKEEKLKTASVALIDTTMGSIIARKSTLQERRSFLNDQKLQIWNLLKYNTIGLSDATLSRLTEEMESVDFLQLSDGDLNPELVHWLDQIKSQSPSLKPSRLDAPPGWNHTMTVFDGVFTRRLPEGVATPMLTYLSQFDKNLLGSIEAYLQYQFNRYIAKSTEKAKALYDADVPTQELLHHVIRESRSIRQTWADFQANLSALMTPVIRSVRTRGATDKQIEDLQNLFESSTRSIIIAVEYPHMMALFYKLSLQRFSVFLPFIGHVDSADLMQLLFDGKLPPLFNYTEGKQILTPYELLLSFDFGVRSGVFEAAKIDLDDFISNTISRFIEEPFLEAKKTFDGLEQRFKETPVARDLIDACREFEVPTRLAYRTMDFEMVSRSPYYGDLLDLFQESFSSRSSSKEPGGLDEIKLGVFFPDHVMTEASEITRFDLGAAMRKARLMRASALNYLITKKGLNVDRASKSFPKTEALIKRVELERERHFKMFLGFQRRYGSCYLKIAQKNLDFQYQLLDYEIKHLQAIHRSIRQLRNRQTPTYLFAFSGLPSDFKGYDKIDAEGYTMHEVDAVLRMARYMERGLLTDQASLPALSPNLSINYGSSLTLDSGIVRSTKIRRITYTESEDEFVANGIRLLVGEYAPLLNFHLNKNSPLINWENHLSNLISMYHIGIQLGRPQEERSELVNYMIGGQLAIAEYVRIQEQDLKIMNILGSDEKFPPLNLSGRFIHSDTVYPVRVKDTWALLDLVVMMGAQPELGWAWQLKKFGQKPLKEPPVRENYLIGPRAYYLALSPDTRATTVLPYSGDTDAAFDKVYGRFYQNQLDGVATILSATKARARELEALPESQRPYTDINTRIRVTKILTSSLVDDFYFNAQRVSNESGGLVKVPR